MTWMEWLEAGSYIVTVVALPFAIWVFILEQRKERLKDDEELYQRLADEYSDFLQLVLQHPDLRLMGEPRPSTVFSEEQVERRNILFDILVSLFERAFILVYEAKMDRQTARLWQSWEDWMREWCRRRDFRAQLPALLHGEDPDFSAYIGRIATEEGAKPIW
jgi:hypothetical protein